MSQPLKFTPANDPALASMLYLGIRSTLRIFYDSA